MADWNPFKRITGAAGQTAIEPPKVLVEETAGMADQRRETEQRGLRSLTGAKVADAPLQQRDEQHALGAGYAPETDIKKHPLLQGQQFDGMDEVDPADPTISPEIKEKIRQKRQLALEKRLELQNRLENQPTNRPRFSPRPGGGPY